MDIHVRADRPAGGDLAEHGDLQHLGAAQGAGQANATGLVGGDLDEAGFGQRLDMLARDTARGKTEGRGDIGQARRLGLIGDALTNEVEDSAAFGR
ncbi:hypothetical protein D3C76_1567320 [compost metagenome]